MKALFFEALFYRDIGLDYIKQLAGQLPYGALPIIEPIVTRKLTPIESAIFFNGRGLQASRNGPKS